MSDELDSFVKDSLSLGLERSAIRDVLLQAGWREDELTNALSAYADITFPVPVPRPKPYLQAREAFLYLVSFIALYVTAFSLITLIFGFIDRAFPDPLSYRGAFQGQYISGSMRMALASIIITFPVYLFLMWRLTKDSAVYPERRQSRLRKWLTYLTLVIASSIITGDLITMLAKLLGGDLTIPFILKVLTILLIIGSIFGYYLWDLRQSEKVDQQ
ncbi:MAG TPA: hypothetical protein DCL97_13060 [Dehalococcoidia bacterium]|nr:hypothetical protein [Dehalococcoidia bacterium]